MKNILFIFCFILYQVLSKNLQQITNNKIHFQIRQENSKESKLITNYQSISISQNQHSAVIWSDKFFILVHKKVIIQLYEKLQSQQDVDSHIVFEVQEKYLYQFNQENKKKQGNQQIVWISMTNNALYYKRSGDEYYTLLVFQDIHKNYQEFEVNSNNSLQKNGQTKNPWYIKNSFNLNIQTDYNKFPQLSISEYSHDSDFLIFIDIKKEGQIQLEMDIIKLWSNIIVKADHTAKVEKYNLGLNSGQLSIKHFESFFNPFSGQMYVVVQFEEYKLVERSTKTTLLITELFLDGSTYNWTKYNPLHRKGSFIMKIADNYLVMIPNEENNNSIEVWRISYIDYQISEFCKIDFLKETGENIDDILDLAILNPEETYNNQFQHQQYDDQRDFLKHIIVIQTKSGVTYYFKVYEYQAQFLTHTYCPKLEQLQLDYFQEFSNLGNTNPGLNFIYINDQRFLFNIFNTQSFLNLICLPYEKFDEEQQKCVKCGPTLFTTGINVNVCQEYNLDNLGPVYLQHFLQDKSTITYPSIWSEQYCEEYLTPQALEIAFEYENEEYQKFLKENNGGGSGDDGNIDYVYVPYNFQPLVYNNENKTCEFQCGEKHTFFKDQCIHIQAVLPPENFCTQFTSCFSCSFQEHCYWKNDDFGCVQRFSFNQQMVEYNDQQDIDSEISYYQWQDVVYKQNPNLGIYKKTASCSRPKYCEKTKLHTTSPTYLTINNLKEEDILYKQNDIQHYYKKNKLNPDAKYDEFKKNKDVVQADTENICVWELEYPEQSHIIMQVYYGTGFIHEDDIKTTTIQWNVVQQTSDSEEDSYIYRQFETKLDGAYMFEAIVGKKLQIMMKISHSVPINPKFFFMQILSLEEEYQKIRDQQIQLIKICFVIGVVFLTLLWLLKVCVIRYVNQRYNLDLIEKLTDDQLSTRIKKLKKDKVIKECGFIGQINDPTCVFCLEEMTEESKCYQLFCSHVFHDSCFEGYVRQNRNKDCPVCRKKFKDIKQWLQESKNKKKNTSTTQEMSNVNNSQSYEQVQSTNQSDNTL